ncbi:DUF2075 domain-containing protein [Liquorilactobacillus oeni]|uniref:AAA+ ATPase domain-containing protein n=1 Tax=Liquorilactobacillus oeni DSM 19972 TaxID=1423777 RepID=A0A0R1MCX7_9LACO|nr:DUF2075 domain-containing protein [Liquorilactobacillus oeni]KRL05745.1 hypothetical protein FD46_GL000496 [Liquorilactobacillus oeni DSM 19972]
MIVNDNEAVKKIAPSKNLTREQLNLKKEILAFCEKQHNCDRKRIFIVEGNAGTGKSLVMSSLFSQLQKKVKVQKESGLYNTKNYLLVNHPEMLKLYKNVAGTDHYLLKKEFERPTTFINRMEKEGKTADIVLIDEAHLLLTKKDRYNHFEHDNQLEEIIKYSRVIILVFDVNQVLKGKSLWTSKRLAQITKSCDVQIFKLTAQFRVQAEPDVKKWLTAFTNKMIMPFPHKQKFDFRIVDNAQQMYTLIKKHDREVGLSRLLATYDYPYRLDGKDYFVTAGNLRIRWDRSKPTEKLPWAERKDTVAEVGSVYTIQGFDLNYAGVILGPSVSYDEQRNCLLLRPEFYEDQAAFNGLKQQADSTEKLQKFKEQVMLNAMYVLLTRARKGLYIFAADEKLRTKLMKLKTI